MQWVIENEKLCFLGRHFDVEIGSQNRAFGCKLFICSKFSHAEFKL